VPYLSALEVCLRQGAIQIQVYLTLPYLEFSVFSSSCCWQYICLIEAALTYLGWYTWLAYFVLGATYSFFHTYLLNLFVVCCPFLLSPARL